MSNETMNTTRRIRGQQTILELMKKIIPEREYWRLEVIRIIRRSNYPISSYAVTSRLNKSGLKTSISSVHPFFDALVESGLCYRHPRWKEVGRKFVKITSMGKEFCNVLNLKLSNETADDQ